MRERLAAAARALVLPLLALASGVGVLALLLAAGGFEPGVALGALWRGAFGSWYAFTSATLVRAVPLALIALGFALAWRAGALNIGGEGQFYAGAIAATWAGLAAGAAGGALARPLVLGLGALAGAAWVAVPAVLRLRFGVLEVISTLLLNFVAEALVSYVVQGPLQESQHIYPQSDPLPAGARLPLLPGTRLHAGVLLALAAAAALRYLFRRTALGFRLRASGAGPRAARVTGGIDVPRLSAWALVAAGALAGLAGASEVAGVSYALYPNLSPGYGFTAIAVALLARGEPLGILPSAVLFGALEAGAAAMQREAGVPAVGVYLAEAVIIVAVLLADALAARRRAALAGATA